MPPQGIDEKELAVLMPKLLLYALRYRGSLSPEAARDLVQQTLVKIVDPESGRHWPEGLALRSFAFGTLRSELSAAHRRAENRWRREDDLLATDELRVETQALRATEDQVERGALVRDLARWLGNDRRRDVVIRVAEAILSGQATSQRELMSGLRVSMRQVKAAYEVLKQWLRQLGPGMGGD